MPLVVSALLVCAATVSAQSPSAPSTDLDALMAQALQRRDVDRRALNDYVLDETETFDIAGPGGIRLYGTKRDYTYYVRDGFHIRSPLRVDGVPVSEADRRKYEADWLSSEQQRRQHRTERAAKAAASGKTTRNGPPINEPRFVSESYFLDFKFEPGNYYLSGRDRLDGHDVFKIDYYPKHLFDDDEETGKNQKKTAQGGSGEGDEITRQMNKTSQVTLWVDPSLQQIVKYTFKNVWLDFLPAGWIVRIDDLKADMEMEQPFPGVWLPKNILIHAAATTAAGSVAFTYRREFSNYRLADVSARIKVIKDRP